MQKTKKQILSEIDDILKDRQDKSKQLAKQNKDLAYSKTDAYKYVCLCHDLIYKLGISKAKKENTKSLELELEKNKKLLVEELKKVDLKIQDLKVVPSCSECNDTGFVKNKMCKCYKKLLNEKLLENSGLSKSKLPSFKSVNFEVFNNNVLDNVKKLYSFAENYTNKENPEKTFVTICGKVGVGKTYLTECMLNEYIKQNKFVQFITSFELNNIFLNYHLANIENKKEILDYILNCDVLVIDDLGTENILKNVTVEYLYLIISERQRNKKITIITTNLNPNEISEKYDERIFSRLCDKQNCYLFNFEGSDLRLKK